MLLHFPFRCVLTFSDVSLEGFDFDVHAQILDVALDVI